MLTVRVDRGLRPMFYRFEDSAGSMAGRGALIALRTGPVTVRQGQIPPKCPERTKHHQPKTAASAYRL
jgi:hypothetical protein